VNDRPFVTYSEIPTRCSGPVERQQVLAWLEFLIRHHSKGRVGNARDRDLRHALLAEPRFNRVIAISAGLRLSSRFRFRRGTCSRSSLVIRCTRPCQTFLPARRNLPSVSQFLQRMENEIVRLMTNVFRCAFGPWAL
jgi:hypothetical protein